MLGPEEIPYSLLGSYADTISTTYNLNEWQTRQFLINDIPVKDLPVISQKTYDQTAKLADTPESPDYHGALKSIDIAHKIDNTRRVHTTLFGGMGALTGGALGLGIESAVFYDAYVDSYDEYVASLEENPVVDISLIEGVETVGYYTGPILAASIAGAYIGKKLAPKLLKRMAGATVKIIRRGHTVRSHEGDLYPSQAQKSPITHVPQTPENHPEVVDELPLYATAQRWANLKGCTDERLYADFLAADLPPTELTMRMRAVEDRLKHLIANESEPSPQDPHYSHLLRDMQIVHAISSRRYSMESALHKISRGVAYAGAIGIYGFLLSGSTDRSSNISEPPESYGMILLGLAGYASAIALGGVLLGVISSQAANRLAQMQSKLRTNAPSATEPTADSEQ